MSNFKLREAFQLSSTSKLLAGHDFLFLFDLIACTCGRAATLRVLSYTSASFENLCQPRLAVHLASTTETSVKASC